MIKKIAAIAFIFTTSFVAPGLGNEINCEKYSKDYEIMNKENMDFIENFISEYVSKFDNCESDKYYIEYLKKDKKIIIFKIVSNLNEKKSDGFEGEKSFKLYYDICSKEVLEVLHPQ